MFSKKALVKSVSIISGATFLSRILGFVRDVLTARVFGTGWIIQSFIVAFRLPNMLRDLLGEGASNSVFVPVFSDYLVKKDKKEFWKFINTALLFVFLVSIALVLIGILFSPFIVRIVAPGFSQNPEKLNLAVNLTRALFPYFLFLVCTAFMMGVLNTFKVFLPSALSPSIFNIFFISSLLIAKNSVTGIIIVVAGIFISGAAQIFLHIHFLKKQGFCVLLLNFHKNIFAHPGIIKITKLLGPRVIGSALYDLNVLVDTIFASLSALVGQGAIAAIYYANRMIQFPLGVFGVAISNASLPTLSEFVAKKQMDKFADTVEFNLGNIFFVMLPSSFGLMALSVPIVRVIFERGEFGPYSTLITSSALAFYALGICGFSISKFLSSCFFAMHDTVTPLKMSFFSLALNIGLNILFVVFFRMGIAGLAFASSISASVVSLYVFGILKKRVPQINRGVILPQAFLMFLASALMGAAIYRMNIVFAGVLHPAAALFISIALGAAVYFIAAFLLGVQQVKKIWQLISRKK